MLQQRKSGGEDGEADGCANDDEGHSNHHHNLPHKHHDHDDDDDDVGANGPLSGDESGSPGEQAPLSPLPPPTRGRMREPSPVCLATKKVKPSVVGFIDNIN